MCLKVLHNLLDSNYYWMLKKFKNVYIADYNAIQHILCHVVLSLTIKKYN